MEQLESRILPAQQVAHLLLAPPEVVNLHMARALPQVVHHAANLASQGPALAVPGLLGQTVRTHFTWTGRHAQFHNELGLFLVDDAHGHIGKLQPGDRGYATAALSRSRSRVLFASGQTAGASRVLDLPSARFFGVYLIPNGTSAAFRAHNPRNLRAGRPVALFSFMRANPDGRDHIHWLSGNTFGWSAGGGRDFGNLTARVAFGKPQGIPLASLPAPVVSVPAPTVPPAQNPSAEDPFLRFLLTPVPEDAALALHIHPHLTLRIDGQSQVIPEGIGLVPDGALPIHTHDASGTLHIESPVLRDFRLQDFFTIWGQTAAGQDILNRLTGSGRQRTMTVNGQPSTAFGSLVLRDGDDIVLRAVLPGSVVPPAAPRFDLSATSRSGSADEHSTAFGRVTLVGQTDPNTPVILVGTNATAVSSSTGMFQIPNVPLVLGDNPLTVRAINPAGGSADFSLTIHRVEQTTQTNAVLTWNRVLLEAVRQDASPPPVASRGMAMVQAAILDAVNALDGTPARFVTLTAPAGASADAAVAAAAHRVLSYLYPAQQASFDAALATSLGPVADGPSKTGGIALGQAAGDALIALRAHDGFDTFVEYFPGSAPGDWQLTPPMYAEALLPQWATLQPFAMTSPDQFRPDGPPDLTSQAWADAFNDVKSLGSANSSTRTADQTQIARFWADGPGSYTPPGHWNAIAAQVAQQQGDSLAEDARLFAELDITLADAAIVAWDAKFQYNTWRPITAIQAADSAGNDQVQADPTWTPFLVTPNFPEYVSGHSTFSGAAATVLDSFFGSNVSFSTTSQTLLGVTRSFTSFAAAAAEAGRSRIYGGIHFDFANQDGQAAGRALAQYVLNTFSLSSDTTPPQALLSTPTAEIVTATNLTVQGRVLDNLSGVASLEVQLDSGDVANLAFDAQGNFTLPTMLPLDGSADGPHVLSFRATDAAGNVATPVELFFTLDTRAPQITLTSPAGGGTIDVNTDLTGTADGTGSAITRLTYQLDSGTVMPVAFDPDTGEFDQALDLSRLAAGQHTLTVTARDAAAHETTVTVPVNLAAAIPFTITLLTPTDGAVDVGTTFRPKVVFARPVDPASLTANNFFATDPSGAKVPARIVPAADGSFSWLFVTGPMPGAARITLHVEGSTIRAAADGALLDADMDGTAGGTLASTFTTVSLTPLLGTTLSGKVVDPGPDLHPMTFDDIRAGADQTLHTADDVFLNPLAGVKVFIVGMEDHAIFTDAAGNFHFDTVPAGDVKLALDGRTATNAPAGFYFPEMVMDLNLEAGRANTVMGTMGTAEEQRANRDRQEVYLPRLQTTLLHDVSLTVPTMIGVDAVSAPDITPQQRSVLSLEVMPGSLIGMDGNPMATGQVGISTVPPELVRDMLPTGLMQLAATLTIQAPSVATFAQPVRLSFPNLYGAAPGTKLNFYSFDHTTGRLVIDGTATVSADGLSVHTDPGTGITHPGWFGTIPPGSPSGPGPGPGPGPNPGPPPPDDPGTCDLPAAPAAAGAGGFAPLKSCPLPTTETLPVVVLPLITGEAGFLSDPELFFKAPALGTAKSLTVKIEIDGPLSGSGPLKSLAFMKKVENLSLTNQTFTLTAGSNLNKEFAGEAKTYEELFGNGKGKKGAFSNAGFAALDRDQLYGARIQVTRTLLGTDGSKATTIQAFYLYRFVNATEPDAAKNHVGNTVEFQKTFVDTVGLFASTKVLAGKLPKKFDTTFRPKVPGGEDNPFLRTMNNPAKSAGDIFWQFDPIHTGVLEGTIDIVANNPQDGMVTVGTLNAEGTGAAPITIGLRANAFADELIRVLTSLKMVWIPAGNLLVPVYAYSADNTTAPPVLVKVNSPGPGGAPVPRWELNKAPHGAKDSFPGPSGMAGGADEAKFKRYQVPSLSFQAEFAEWMPNQRALPGPDGVLGDDDDQFSPEQLAALTGKAVAVGAQLRDAVEKAFMPVVGTTGVIQVVNTGSIDFIPIWQDAFLTPGDGRDQGTTGTGDPIPAFTDTSEDDAALKDVLGNKGIPLAAKMWILGEELNSEARPLTGSWSVAADMDGASTTTNFATHVARVLTHELGHSFGLKDAYNVDAKFGGKAGCMHTGTPNVGDCIPYDVMEAESPLDLPNELKFAATNRSLLKASLGIAKGPDPKSKPVLFPLREAVRQYQNTFNLSQSSKGLDNVVSADPPTTPQIALVTDDQEFFGSADEDSVDFGTVAADGPGGAAGDVTFQVENDGGGPLTVTRVSLAKGDQGFSVPDAAALLGTPIAPGESRTLTVHFDPTVAGAAHDTLILTSDAEMMPMLLVSLTGDAFTKAPFAQVDVVGNNNLGGGTVGGGTALTSEIFQITNAGLDPLQITGVVLPEGNGAFRLLGVPADLATQPITLARGESFTFGARFDPEKAGLARALIDVSSNDPERPTLRLSVVGTGTEPVPRAAWGQDYVALDTPELGGAPLRVRSDDTGNFELFLPPETSYELTIFDPETGLAGLETGVTSPSGQRTELVSTMVFLASTAADTDYDGLPDDLEHAIGTSPTRPDTDGNGLDDFAEIQQGLDPLGGRPVTTGILAQLPLTGTAKHIVTAGATGTSQADLAYVATGSGGLAIVDVSQFGKPILLAELDLPGDATDVAFDSVRGLAAVATGASGLAVIDVSTPTAPRLVRTISVATSQVEVSNGIAYVTDGDSVRSFDLTDGNALDQVYLGAPTGGLARDGGFLYATSATNVLTILDLSQPFLTRRGQVQLSSGQGAKYDGPAFVGGGVAYVMNTIDSGNIDSGGFATVDISDPDLPKLISSVDRAAFPEPAAAVAVNGSGLALLAGNPLIRGGSYAPRLDLLDISDPRNTYQLLRSIALPSAPFDVLTAGGAAFVADGAGGLAIVNYLPLDVDGQPPQLTVLPDPSGKVPTYTAGQAVRLRFNVQDDVQVRRVELLFSDDPAATLGHPLDVAYTVIRSSLSFPYDDLEFPAPPLPPLEFVSNLTWARLRATDTGGNVTLSAPIPVQTVRDVSPPIYYPRSFVDNSVRAAGLAQLGLFFSKPLARTQVNSQTFRIVDAQDQPVSGFAVRTTGDDIVVQLSFDPLPVGAYRLIIDGAHVTDRSGNPLGTADIVTHFQIVQGTANAWINRLPFSDDWGDPTNWTLGRVPGPTDVVTIDIPADKTVTFAGGPADAVLSLEVIGGTLVISRGSLTVNTTSRLDNLAIAGGRLEGSGDLTINKSLLLAGGGLSGAGQTIIPVGATAELRGGILDSRPLTVSGLLKVTGSLLDLSIVRSPVIEIRQAGTLQMTNNAWLNSGDSLPFQINLFGQLVTDPGAFVNIGGEVEVMPGGRFDLNAGRIALLGGGRFNAPLSLAADSILYLRGPLDASKPAPRYVFPAGLTHQIDGPLLIGGADVVLGGDANVRILDFAGDSYGFFSRSGVVTIDGTLTVTERLGTNSPALFGPDFARTGVGGGGFQGKGELLIPAGATFGPHGQTFRGVTIINRGTLDFRRSTGGFSLGAGAVFEQEGTMEGSVLGDGRFEYGSILPASTPDTPDEPFDSGTFNARVPLEIKGMMDIRVTLNVYAGLTVSNPVSVGGITDFSVTLSGGGTFHGPINVAPRVSFELLPPTLGNDPRRVSNVFTFAADSQVQLGDDFRVIESSVVANANLTVGQLYFYGASGGGIYTNTISGPGNIDVTRQLIWRGGRIATTGVVTVKPSAIFQFDGNGDIALATVLDGTTLIHQGTVLGSYLVSSLTMMHGAVLRNEGTLEANGFTYRIWSGEGSGRIDNYGAWTIADYGRNNVNILVDVPFVNYGTMRINDKYNNRWRFSDLTNNGMLIVGPHVLAPYLVEVRGDYIQAAAATLRVELSNANPLYTILPLLAGTLDIDGQARLAGKLEVDFVKYDPTQPFTDHPAAGESYPLLTFASRTGDFAQMTSLDLANGYDYNFVSTATSLTAVAKAAP